MAGGAFLVTLLVSEFTVEDTFFVCERPALVNRTLSFALLSVQDPRAGLGSMFAV